MFFLVEVFLPRKLTIDLAQLSIFSLRDPSTIVHTTEYRIVKNDFHVWAIQLIYSEILVTKNLYHLEIIDCFLYDMSFYWEFFPNWLFIREKKIRKNNVTFKMAGKVWWRKKLCKKYKWRKLKFNRKLLCYTLSKQKIIVILWISFKIFFIE